jgi:hypothetical protein
VARSGRLCCAASLLQNPTKIIERNQNSTADLDRRDDSLRRPSVNGLTRKTESFGRLGDAKEFGFLCFRHQINLLTSNIITAISIPSTLYVLIIVYTGSRFIADRARLRIARAGQVSPERCKQSVQTHRFGLELDQTHPEETIEIERILQARKIASLFAT